MVYRHRIDRSGPDAIQPALSGFNDTVTTVFRSYYGAEKGSGGMMEDIMALT